MSQKHIGLGLTGDHSPREPNWGVQLDRDIAAASHMSYPALKQLAPRLNGTPDGVSPGDIFIIGTGSGWGTLDDGLSSRGHIAVRDLGRWYYYRVRQGMVVYVKETSSDNNGTYPPGLYLYSGTAWQKMDIVNPEPYVPEAAAWYKSLKDSNNRSPAIFAGRPVLVSSSSSSFVSSFSPSSSSPSPFNSNGTCRIPGLYQINAAITFDPPDNDQQIFTYWLQKNNIRIASGTVTPDAAERLALTVNLSALDVISLYESITVYFSWQRGSVTIQGGNGLTKLDILKVG